MQQHIPVLLKETLEILSPQAGDRILDVTLGLGGHSEALLEAAGKAGSLVALDADMENIAIAKENLKKFGSRVTILHSNFSELPNCLPEDQRQFDIILADLGLSSPHIDDPTRGFTFRTDAPLDMRFDRSSGMTAAMLLASLDEEKLRKIFWEFGELPKVRPLVTEIVARRTENPIRSSSDLTDAAKVVYGYKSPQMLPQLFQALRMAVNREREALGNLLAAIPFLLAPGGRCAVIAYHSIEDTLVKTAFRSLAADEKDLLTGSISKKSEFVLLTRKPIAASEQEIQKNPRSRSARLRAIAKRTEYTDHRTASC